MEKDPNINTMTNTSSNTAVAESPAVPTEREQQTQSSAPERSQETTRSDRRPRGNGRRNGDFNDGRGGRDSRPYRDNSRRRQTDTEATATIRYGLTELGAMPVTDLQKYARELGIVSPNKYRKQELAQKLLQTQAEQAGFMIREGVLDIIEDGFGFLRQTRYLPAQDDVYVSQSQIRRFSLRTGDYVVGQVRPPKDSEKYPSLLRVESVNRLDPEASKRRPIFDRLTPIFPDHQLILETNPKKISTRLIDLVSPIGRGQRGLIVSPPKSGKTTLLKDIANGLTTNYEDIHLMMVLVGERPEEVTDIRRSVKGEVIAATFDEPVEDHTKVAEMALERAKRLVECGKDVVILMDSITRLARAYNVVVPVSGRTLSGGIDPVALYPPKRFFGAARNIDEGGSLTIIATCLVDTGSRMDDVIYEEFKGTGNLELHLDRKLEQRRIFPAIDIQRSSTRREELLISPERLKYVYTMRRMVAMVGGTEATEAIVQRMLKTSGNDEFLMTLNKEVL